MAVVLMHAVSASWQPGDSVFQSDFLNFGSSTVALTLATNLMCTILIAGRIWLVTFLYLRYDSERAMAF